ncbi:MAG: hypothetical protein Q7Q71_10375 [Verrucomicrobiota bacterium JB023]|nr:hypothetical protein [Verrucomicrobiota bacterium JB023]
MKLIGLLVTCLILGLLLKAALPLNLKRSPAALPGKTLKTLENSDEQKVNNQNTSGILIGVTSAFGGLYREDDEASENPGN